jgi:signal transduction histidine kinase
MQFHPQNDPFPSGNSVAPASGSLPVKSTVILIRWPVVLISSSLILYRTTALTMSPFLDALVIFYALSNVGLYFVDESVFRKLKFNILLVGVDTLVLTASLIINGQSEANFYLTYFLLIIICSIFENPRMIAIVSLVAPLAYAGFFFQSTDYHPGNYLQLAFLIVVGLFYGHFAQLVRTQRVLTERAEQKNQAKTELLNILSHELKTPLTVIASYAQALKSAALGEINRDQEEALSKVLRQTENLENIVNVLLDSASVETGAVAVRVEELVLSEFLEELKQNYEGIVVGPKVTLVWDYPVPMPVVMSDPGKLKMILQNLINNAVKFTDAGEIRVAAGTDPQRQKMEFIVSDTGIGIASDQLPFVFDKFWQVDAARTRTQSGIGMGLYIVKAFTESLRGTITVNSTPGMGSKFRVELPTV